jgi:tetratricopeptide (TPR) repeat protein
VVGAATAENNIGEVLSDLGRFDEAQPLFEEALAVWQRAPFPAGAARALVNLARLSIRRGRAAEAGPLLDAGERTAGDVGAEMFLFEARACRADMLLGVGEVAEASGLADELLERAPSISPSPVVMAGLMLTSGVSRRLQGDETAVARVRGALDLFERTGMAWDAARARAALENAVIEIPQQRTIALDTAPDELDLRSAVGVNSPK